MFITTKNREEIMQYLFKEGVIVAENKKQKKHSALSVSNLEVIQLMRGFATRKLVKEQYAWRHYYYFLTDEGIKHLREVLFIPADIMPATMKKTASSMGEAGGDRRRQWRNDDGTEGDRPRRQGGYGRGFKREEGEGAKVEAPAAPAAATAETQADEAW